MLRSWRRSRISGRARASRRSEEMRLANFYRTFFRDSLLALSRAMSRAPDRRALVLDMDWYRFSLNDEEMANRLYAHPALSGLVDFVRIDRGQVIPRGTRALRLDGRNPRDITWKGYSLWGLCKASLASFLGRIEPDLSDAAQVEVVEHVYGEAVQCLQSMERILLRIRPDAILLFQGGFFDSRCAREVARRLGVRVIALENSMMSDQLFLDDLSGFILNRHRLARLGGDMLEVEVVGEDERKTTYDWWRQSLASKRPEHRTGGIDDPEEIRRLLGIPPEEAPLVLLGQVATDASVVLDSPLFPDLSSFIRSVVEAVREGRHTILVIRLHPKEATGNTLDGKPYNRMTFRELERLGITSLPHVRIVEDSRVSTYSLIRMAKGCITLTSQAGFEAALMGKRVLVCGDAFYARKGFTMELGHPAFLDTAIAQLLEEGDLLQEEHNRAIDFLLLMKRHVLYPRDLRGVDGRLRRLFGVRREAQRALPIAQRSDAQDPG